jgi:Cys-tRNA(Pro) deacylase
VPASPAPGVGNSGTLVKVSPPPVAEAWPEPVERVAAALRGAGAEARVEQFPAAAHTAEEAAAAIGCDLDRIVKSLLFDCDGVPVLVLVPGDRRADRDKVARATGAKRARVASAGQVEADTGYPPGGVSPFALARVGRVLLDNNLMVEGVVWVGAGSTTHMAGLPATELVRVARAEPADVVTDT